MVDSILYTPLLQLSECSIENNEGIFWSNNDRPSLVGQDKENKLIRILELVADDIVKVLEISSTSLIKKSIKWRAKETIMPIHITAIPI